MYMNVKKKSLEGSEPSVLTISLVLGAADFGFNSGDVYYSN